MGSRRVRTSVCLVAFRIWGWLRPVKLKLGMSPSPAAFTDVFYQVDRDFGGVGDQSKTTLGLLITNSPNLFWQTNMAPRPFPNIAQCAYIRDGLLIDGRKRLALEIVATGSLGSTKR
eukprot:CAMPEP_0179839774 /NCGR_PEP_ID=MMETSP0982-20121206/1516_1 /TAXON_ID=483367 /ORGANISM="non described non described, Strain CCMP 2436" /LENGTH=116 /DNA_ID=CAMNT_0021723489 /DNA_START=117 /DNA_END=463 /DNA_ORIENTATION=+